MSDLEPLTLVHGTLLGKRG